MSKQRTNYFRDTKVFPDDFPQRIHHPKADGEKRKSMLIPASR